MTPYYSLEHGGMLEYALRVTLIFMSLPNPQGNLNICVQFSMNLKAFWPHKRDVKNDECLTFWPQRPHEHKMLEVARAVKASEVLRFQ